MAWWGFLISYDSAYAGRAPSSSSGLRLVRQRSRSVVGRISRSKCCARLLRRAHYPRQFGGGLCIANEPCAAPPPNWRGGSSSVYLLCTVVSTVAMVEAWGGEAGQYHLS